MKPISLILPLLLSWQSPSSAQSDMPLSQTDQTIVDHSNDLGFNLLRLLPAQQSTVFSPASISCLLSLINDGATGKTSEELTRLLGASPEETDNFYARFIPYITNSQQGARFSMANALFTNKMFPLEKPFAKQVKKHYQALVRSIDFSNPSTAASINRWCAKQTKGMIPQMVDKTEADEMLYALNAVFFESCWMTEFSEQQTKKESFTTGNGTRKDLPLMHRKGLISYARQDHYALVSLPYKGDKEYDMIVMLPDEGHSVGEMLQSLNADTWNQVLQKRETWRVDLKLPRFEITANLGLNDPMARLGIPTAFSKSDADFSLIANLGQLLPGLHLYISQMQQKARIEVTEKGTRAVAVTLAKIAVAGAIAPSEYRECQFHANRPFVYAITEQSTGSILFIGQYCGDK